MQSGPADTKNNASVFAAFSISLAFLGSLFRTAIDRDRLDNLRRTKIIEDWPVKSSDPDTPSGISYIVRFFGDNPLEEEVRLKEDFARLFVGPGNPTAPPYESLYLGKEKILFEAPTLNVRHFYRKFHLQIRDLNKIPDDHIGFELAFLSEICSQLQHGSNEDIQKLTGALRRFLDSHILLWSDQFADLVIEHARTDFYRGTAFLLKGTLRSLDLFMKESVETVHSSGPLTARITKKD